MSESQNKQSTNGDDTRIALVTGANKGIGLETARLLGETGATVLLGARDPERGSAAERDLRDEGSDVHLVALDVTDQQSVKAAAARVESEFGRLDVLVNNAGAALGFGAAPSTSDPDQLRTLLDLNTVSVVTVTNAFLPLLRRSAAGRVVNVSSEVGSIGSMTDPEGPFFGMSGSPAYPVSKTAVNMLTALYAKELADTSVKVNAANPGFCATDLNGHSGPRSARQGALVSLHLANLPEDGPSGVLWGHLASAQDPESYGVLPW
ncbi:SDR family oxidoreductase [Nocardiopsis metallicus]|uniref:NAD(P)-dependent dehydrogenase (Short-subunit alcohol dehydrogenase family) n=1 Tax=Nocardiopsis metallicus TaxID=179819 RepID=A0A840WB47_9ACTN|nr:SDR family oxidoreductase [Nocardiopsis metallicus]MBB5494260.1 NAD(P)-dependent dehydrogenase (short-subunit alcohol dehydrogenase family) [Nocardiopsis metallicus]